MPYGSLGQAPFVVHTARFSSSGQSPGTFAMTPTRCVAETPRAGLKTKLPVSMGPFYGPNQAKEWSRGLKERDDALGRTPEALTRIAAEKRNLAVGERERLYVTHEQRLKAERERHAGGYGQLGCTDDRFSVHVSSLFGNELTSQSPRFLETFPARPQRPAQQELELRKSENPMLLGTLPLEKVKKENRSLNYDPITHKYIGPPRQETALQKRAMKERTGYVTIAGGRKDLDKNMKNCDALSSTMQHYVNYDYQRINPVESWLHDEQTAASGGLRTFPAQKGVSPLTRRLVQCHKDAKVKNWHVNEKQRQRKIEDLTEERVAVNLEQRLNHEKKMALQLSTFKIKDPYTDHIWGVNHGREAQPYRGYNTTLQQHYRPHDESSAKTKEEALQADKRKRGLERRANETHYDILHGADKRPGKEGMMLADEPAAPLTERQISEIEKSNRLKGIIGHDHSLDPKVNGFHTTHKSSYDSPRKRIARFGVKSGGNRFEDFTRYESGQNQVHMESHANDESSDRDKKWEHHGHEDAADRYGSGRLHIKGAGHTNVESGTQEHSQLNAHGANIDRARIRYEANNNLPKSHRTDETAGDVWNAGSDEKYKHMESRSTGATILKEHKSIAKDIGSANHVSLKDQHLAQHTNRLSVGIAHRDATDVYNPKAMAHHGKGYDHNVSEETDLAHATGAAHRSLANNNEDLTRFDHIQHHHGSYAHNQDETSETMQFHSANNSGEENRFYEANGGFGSAHHKAVGIDETTASKQIWEAMAVEGYEKVEPRKGTSVLIQMYKEKDPSASVKAVTSKDRSRLKTEPRADHWKFDGDKNNIYVPRRPPLRTDATRGVARFI